MHRPFARFTRFAAARAALLWWPVLAAASAAPAPAATLADCDAGFEQRLSPVPAAAAALDASAAWLDGARLRWPQADAAARTRLLRSASGEIVARPGAPASGADSTFELQLESKPLSATTAERFGWLGAGPEFALRAADRARIAAAHREQLVLVQEDVGGRVLRATTLQVAAALDDLYAAAERVPEFGATVRSGRAGRTAFRLWAPTARSVAVCLHDDSRNPARALHALRFEPATGTWSATLPRDLSGSSYTYLVDVFVHGIGWVRNRVTDPYSLSLDTDSQRSWIGRLDSPATKPPGWDSTPRQDRVRAATDLVIYELHVRDFSIGDATVPAAHRGKYLAFTDTGSSGMRHLRALSQAGLTDVHLLPVFDIASVPEAGCTTPLAAELQTAVDADPASPLPQARVMAGAAGDCFNWGYDPLHYTAPEGSYATDPADGAARIREFRAMVQALHRAGLRVGMDMVYNHTSAAGQKPPSVLDRIVPGYYHRLDAQGRIEHSTCCDNTATEHRMMARLMIDSAVVWARDHRIDSMRFDLMGHQPRAAMERLQRAVDRASGRHIHLIGEGWNFGEVANGARFVQAAQGRLNGSGIATFSDRTRDAVRGGGAGDSGLALLQKQGWINGLHVAPNAQAHAAGLDRREDLLRAADLVRVGLAGTLRDVRLRTHDGTTQPLSAIDYAGQGAGYASQPGEVVNYVENHDNQTLFDNNVLKLPRETSAEDRARVQLLGLAVTAFSQGIAYFHAGVEMLRSKSLDRNSFDSGDWFNRLDWSLNDNFFGTGLPPEGDNRTSWPLMAPLLADRSIKPAPQHIRFTRDAFLDLLKIRTGSTLFRLRSTAEVQRRLSFLDTGPSQRGSLIVARLDGLGLPGARFAEVLYAINADPAAQTLVLPELAGRAFVLHPVQRAAAAADGRPRQSSTWDAASGTLTVPARTALVYVRQE